MTRRRLSRQQLARIRGLQAERRTRAAHRASGEAAHDEAGPERLGLVIANFGLHAVVEDESGALWRCTARQNLERLVCGDRVVWQAAGTEEGVVSAVQPRRTLLRRPDHGSGERPVAANLDQMVVVLAPRPEPLPALVDRYLVAAHSLDVRALLVLNKADLLRRDDPVEALLEVYEHLHYTVLRTAAKSGAGMDRLRQALAGHTSILVGQSGVGKSSLVKALLPDLDIATRAVSTATGLGTHTTSASTLYHLPGSGDLIDSPGVRGFNPSVRDADTLARGFVELEPLLSRCRFSNCGHRSEPGCALREAVARGEVDSRRLDSYLQLLADLQSGFG